MRRVRILAFAWLLLSAVGMAPRLAYAFKSSPAIWHQGLSISRLVGYQNYSQVVQIKCPDGGNTEDLEPVLP